MPLKNQKLDSSHHAFKRSKKIGPGPGGPGPKGEKRTVTQAQDWECKKVKPFGPKKDAKKYYFQLCEYVGEEKQKIGKRKKVKIKKDYKKKYNKKYQKYLKDGGKPRFANSYNPNYNTRTGRAKRV